jgi:ABC-type transport system involved in cytochrome c biogenesis permease subunit
METLVKLSFYFFAASSVALGAASLSYIAYTIGRVKVRRATMATSAGTTVTSTTADFSPGNISFGRWGSMLTWFGAIFAFMAVLFRTIGAERLPTANMYEFSLSFVLAISIIYIAFERMYSIKQLGSIVLPIAFGMTLYIWSLPAELREITPLIPALQARPIMTIHVASGIFAYATAGSRAWRCSTMSPSARSASASRCCRSS